MNVKEITALIKQYNTVRNERLGLDEQSKKLKVQEDSLLDQMTVADVKPGKYGPYFLSITTKPVPRCTDWPTFHAYVLQTGNLDMLHKRLTESAVMERIEAGEHVPAIVTDEKVTYKVTAA